MVGQNVIKRRKRDVDDIINKGNRAYFGDLFREAEYHFTKAIESLEADKLPCNQYYLSRANCYYELGWHTDCINDCSYALKNDPSLIKAYVTKARAQCYQFVLVEALDTVEAGLRRDRNDEDLQALNKEIPAELLLGDESKYFKVPDEEREAILEAAKLG